MILREKELQKCFEYIFPKVAATIAVVVQVPTAGGWRDLKAENGRETSVV